MSKPADLDANDPVAAAQISGPTDITDPMLRQEARKAMVWIGIAALTVLVIMMAQPILVVFGGMVFGALIDGGTRLLGRVLKIGRGWRIAIVLLMTVLFLMWTATFAGSQITSQAAELPATIQAQGARLAQWLTAHGIAVDEARIRTVIQQATGGVSQLGHAVGGIIGGLTTLFLIVVLGIYIAIEPRLYQRGIAWLLPSDTRGRFDETAARMGRSLRMLMFGRLIGMSLEGLMTWAALQIYGVPMAALIGLLTGLLAFLPNVGAPISGLIMITVGFSGGNAMGIYCIIVYVVLHLVDGNIVVPLVARKTVELAPALVLGAQLIMGAAFGILGLALADPLVAMLKVLLERQSEANDPDVHDNPALAH